MKTILLNSYISEQYLKSFAAKNVVYISLLAWIKTNCYILNFLTGKYTGIKEDMGYTNKHKVFEMGTF